MNNFFSRKFCFSAYENAIQNDLYEQISQSGAQYVMQRLMDDIGWLKRRLSSPRSNNFSAIFFPEKSIGRIFHERRIYFFLERS